MLASLPRLIEKIDRIQDPFGTLSSQLDLVQLHRRLAIVQAEIELLDSGAAILANGEIPPRDGCLRIQMFSFAGGIAKLADGSVMENSRIVFDIDLARYPQIKLLDDDIVAMKKRSAVDEAYNRLDPHLSHGYAELSQKSRDLWRRMTDLIPPGVIVNPRTLLASPGTY